MIFNTEIKISNKLISKSSPVFIIAEAGVNHNGDISIAKALIDGAASVGADAVKFQSFKTDQLILPGIEKASYQKETTGKTENQYEMLKKLEINLEANLELKHYCHKQGIIFLTTPFDELSLDELDALDLPAYKVASTDTTNLPFLKKIAHKGKPIILSTGMTYMHEIELALGEIYPHNKDVILLQCSANYPLAPDEVNLNVLNEFTKNFDLLVGFSDHTSGIGAAPFAIPLGAKIIEKHFTLDKNMPGPDQNTSLDVAEFKKFVEQVRLVEKYLGDEEKKPTISEKNTRLSLQKCLVAAQHIKSGQKISEADIIAKRTGGKGISPIRYKEIVGSLALRDYKINEIIEI